MKFTYKFWGVTADGKRELLGMASATGMGAALIMLADAESITKSQYPRMEVERVDDIFADGRGFFTNP